MPRNAGASRPSEVYTACGCTVETQFDLLGRIGAQNWTQLNSKPAAGPAG